MGDRTVPASRPIFDPGAEKYRGKVLIPAGCSLPGGGGTGNALVKASSLDYDVAWQEVTCRPVGCTPVLTLAANLDDQTVWGCGAPGLIKDGDYLYASSWTQDTVAIVNVHDPLNPTVVGKFTDADDVRFDGPWRSLKDGNYLYVCCTTRDAFFVLNVSNPATPTFVSIVDGFATALPSSPRGLVKDGNYVFLGGSGRGIFTIDVSNPAAPFLAGYNPTPNSFRLQQIVKIGDYIFGADASSTRKMSVFNVADPLNPAFVTSINPATISQNTYGIANIGNVLFQTSVNTDSVVAIDVSTPGSPAVIGNLVDAVALDRANGIHIEGNYLYITGNDQLTIVDATDPTAMFVVDSITDAVEFTYSCGEGIFKDGAYIYTGGYLLGITDDNCGTPTG